MKTLPLALSQRSRMLGMLQVLGLAGALLLGLGLARQALAADAPPEAARTYVIAPGDTLDRIVQKTMGQSPLRIELLREALAAANPQAIPSVRNPRLKAGVVLQLPDHEALLRTTVLPLLPPADTAAHSGGGADARKRWVRYP